MRVLISGLWAAEQPSGICRTVVNLVRGLNVASPSTEIVLALGKWQRGYFDEQLGLNGLKANVIEIDIPNRTAARNLWYLRGLPKLARSVRADLVHLTFPAPVIRKLFHCPVVTTLHDLYPYDRPENFGYPQVWGNRIFLRRALAASDRVICVSQFTLGRLHQHFPEVASRKATYISNAICPAPDAPSDGRIVAYPYFLAVAQHRANKNLELLIRSFHHCRQEQMISPEMQLVVVGACGPETPRLHALVNRLSLHEQVHSLMNQTDTEMAALYRDCELFISLADIEGFGLPVAEALLHGARVLASDIPAHREIAAEKCDYISLEIPRSTEKTAIAMRAASVRPRPSSEAFAHLSAGTTALQYMSVFEDIVRGSGAIQREDGMAAPQGSRVNVFGVAVDALNMRTAVNAVFDAVKRGANSYVCLTGAHGIVEARRNPALADALEKAALVLPDGMPTVWIAKWQAFKDVDRVFGPDLMLRVIDESQRTGERHFFCGGNPGVAEQLAETLRARYPNAQLVGTYTPPFRSLTPTEEIDFSRAIEESHPDIVWMGISTPKQEIFMQQFHARLQTKVMIGVGAAFDFHTGRLNDSPDWVKRAGLQWLHRLAQDPRRLWWRYLRTNTIFLYLAAMELLRRKHYPLAPKTARHEAVAAAKSSFAD